MPAISKGAQLRPWGILIFLLDKGRFSSMSAISKGAQLHPWEILIFLLNNERIMGNGKLY